MQATLCAKTIEIIMIFLGEIPSTAQPARDASEEALHHLKSCQECRGSLDPQQRAQFAQRLALSR